MQSVFPLVHLWRGIRWKHRAAVCFEWFLVCVVGNLLIFPCGLVTKNILQSILLISEGIGIVLMRLSALNDKSCCRINGSFWFTITTKAVKNWYWHPFVFAKQVYKNIHLLHNSTSVCDSKQLLEWHFPGLLMSYVLRDKHNSKWKQGALVSFYLWRSNFFVIIFQRICL